MLGSLGEADDAIQEAWLRLSRSDPAQIENLGGWLTTVVARVCLDMLRSRSSRREESLADRPAEPVAQRKAASDPEQEALMADSVGLALLVVLDRLAPAERLAFVMHDVFGVPFEEIAPVVERTPEAARQLASRARRRVQGADRAATAGVSRNREVVDRFLAALRAGDFEGLLAVLDPEVVVRLDSAAGAPGTPREIRGARAWAQGAIAYAKASRLARAALIDGEPGLILAPRGRLLQALKFTFADGKIAQAEIIAEPARLRELDIAVLNG